MAHHDHWKTGNGKDSIISKNSLPDGRYQSTQSEAGSKRMMTSRYRMRTWAIRKSRWGVAFAWGLAAILLFPILSSSDDFHVCQLSMESWKGPAPLIPNVSSTFQGVCNPEGLFCAACAWSRSENAFPVVPVSLDPDSFRLAANIPLLSDPQEFILYSSRKGRAPPRV